MNERNFDEWLAKFTDTINQYDYYTNFAKVYHNVDNLKLEINILNSLIGSKNIASDFRKIIAKYPECLAVVPILLAVRAKEISCQDERGAIKYNFAEIEQNVEQYQYFMQKTGLFNLLQQHIISNLYDYVTGVEVGLDSNARKNRGGHQMEDLVERYIKSLMVEYYKEMYLTEVEAKWNIDMSPISSAGTSTKRFDFVVKTNSTVYGIETNFYTSGGSKLNETARSYKMIAEEAENITGFEFVWLTDGKGWNSAKRNLHETFDVLNHLYNINDMDNGVLAKVFV